MYEETVLEHWHRHVRYQLGGNKLKQKHTMYLGMSPALLDFPCQFPRCLIKSEVIKNLCHVLHLCFMEAVLGNVFIF
jgi:hypothetical protein